MTSIQVNEMLCVHQKMYFRGLIDFDICFKFSINATSKVFWLCCTVSFEYEITASDIE